MYSTHLTHKPGPRILAGGFLLGAELAGGPLKSSGPSGSLPILAGQLLQRSSKGRGAMTRKGPSTDPATAGVFINAEHLVGAVLLGDEPDKSSGMESHASSWREKAMTQQANAYEL